MVCIPRIGLRCNGVGAHPAGAGRATLLNVGPAQANAAKRKSTVNSVLVSESFTTNGPQDGASGHLVSIRRKPGRGALTQFTAETVRHIVVPELRIVGIPGAAAEYCGFAQTGHAADFAHIAALRTGAQA